MTRALALSMLAVCTAGCWASESQLRTKAAADLGCNPEALSIQQEDGVHHVSGCGESENYRYSDEARTWLRASDGGGRVIIRDR